MVKMILCTDLVGNIGKNNDLLFKMKEDMKFFRESTTGHVVVMGYNTWLSLGEKPLPNRTNIVLYDEDIEGVIVSNDIKKVIEEYKDEDIYIIGGAFVYNQALEMDIVDEILITEVATIGLAESLGSPIIKTMCSVFVLLAMFSSYWTIGLALADVVEDQFKINKKIAWIISTIPTILLAILLPLSILDYVKIGSGVKSIDNSAFARAIFPALQKESTRLGGNKL